MSCCFAQQRSELLVAAAADLARTQPLLSESFAKTAGYRLRFSFGGSGMLARQIANGAPFDVFLSANEHFVRELAAAGKVLPETVQVYAEGRLGLWSRGGSVRSLDDLLRSEVKHIAIANPAHAPYGAAAREALQNKQLWDKLTDRVVYGENVQQALQFAETGNAEAVITSWSLVFDRGGIALPASFHTPIRQFGAIVAATRSRQGASAFLKFLASPEGKQILRRYGFN